MARSLLAKIDLSVYVAGDDEVPFRGEQTDEEARFKPIILGRRGAFGHRGRGASAPSAGGDRRHDPRHAAQPPAYAKAQPGQSTTRQG